ncbi:MAG TPA: DUF2294 domain-containing protein [Chthonomonadales bacterium]|nr:DUF2294 domain-containing protein [Chthonomonadales bacterium]
MVPVLEGPARRPAGLIGAVDVSPSGLLFCAQTGMTHSVGKQAPMTEAARTKGQIEAEAAAAVVRFHREQQGRGPADARAHLVANLLVVRCTGILTPIEAHLAVSEDGQRLVRSARQELRSINHAEIEDVLSRIVGSRVLRSYGDVDAPASELIEVYVLEDEPERRLARG